MQRLIRAGIEAAQFLGAEIIAPDPNALAQGGSIPNRFIFGCADEATATRTVEDARKAVFEAWNRYAERTRGHFGGHLGMAINDAIWTRQTDPQYWLEFYAAIDIAEDDAHFGQDVLNGLMRKIAAQKLVRALPQHPDGEPGYKCSVTGEHEALHDQTSGEISFPDLRAYWNTVRARQRNLALLSEGERLSAFSIVKRFGHEANIDLQIERFPSTSSIASADTRLRLIRNWQAVRPSVSRYLTAIEALYQRYETEPYFASPELLPAYRDALPANWQQDDVLTRFLRLDGDFLYLDHLQPRPLAEHIGTIRHNEIDRHLIENARDALKAVYQSAGIAEPSSYYAMLAMDGDRMGEVAERFEIADEYHMFSGRLTKFALSTMFPEVERAVGRVIFAGGDDLLALLPLNSVFLAAEAIRKAFPEAAHYKTTSAGITIVHRTYSLQAAVRAAKRAEHIAKEKYRTKVSGAFAFEILRRSGEPQSGGSAWERGGVSVIETLIAVRDAMRDGHIARGLASDIPELLYSVVNTNDPEYARQLEREDRLTVRDTVINISDALRETTFKRLFERRCADMYKLAEGLFDHLVKIGGSLPNGQGWFDVQALLYLARFLSQQGGA